jgi:hypothetical protein
MPYVSGREAIVHLAYLDESGTDGHSPIVIFGAVIIFPDKFGHLEGLHCAAIQQIIPVDQTEKFQEFHASELFQGEGPFQGIDKEKRFDAIRVLLTALQGEKFPYVYAAVDRAKLEQSPMGSARALDVAFRVCALGIEDWAQSHHKQHPDFPKSILLDYTDLCLFILDDTTDTLLKKQLRSSYRQLRAAHPYIPLSMKDNRLWHAHDDMYFGDSHDSVGIQMVDLCNYFMWRHLLKKDGGEEFYEMFAGQAICAKPEPEWSTYRKLFVTHDSNAPKPVVELTNANAKGKAAQ